MAGRWESWGWGGSAGAFVINTSRSGVVDEAALLREVRHRDLRAALDVFEGEPVNSTGSIEPGLFAEVGMQGSHHIGASTEQAQHAVADETLRIVDAFVRAGNVPNCVNLVERSAPTHSKQAIDARLRALSSS